MGSLAKIGIEMIIGENFIRNMQLSNAEYSKVVVFCSGFHDHYLKHLLAATQFNMRQINEISSQKFDIPRSPASWFCLFLCRANK